MQRLTQHEQSRLTTEKVKMMLQAVNEDNHLPTAVKSGSVIFEMWDAEGNLVFEDTLKNLIVLDAGIASALILSDPMVSRRISMLAVGTGATGPVLNPDSPDPRQRRLNQEIARKAFSGSAVYRRPDGTVSSVPTNVVDYVTVFGSSEANGPLTEMGLVVPLSGTPTPVVATFPDYDPSIDLRNFDILINYLTFPALTKQNGMILSITWRLTF